MRHLADVALGAWGGRPAPISLVHFITHRCNARCAHCFIDFDTPRPPARELSLEELREVAASLERTLVNVNITGGEPFLNPRIWPICETWLTRARAGSVYVTTHGGLTERVDGLARQFLASQAEGRLFVSISVDDFPAEHDRNRRVSGLFEAALASHARLQAHADPRLGVGVSITVTEHNHARVVELYQWLREHHRVRVVSATLRRAEGVAGPLPAPLARPVGEAYRRLTRAIEADLDREPPVGARRSLVARMQDAKDRMLYAMLREDALAGTRFRSPCPAGGLFLVLQPDGEVHGCEMRPDARLGDLRDHGLDMGRLLAAPAASEWRRRIREGRCHCSYECALGINIIAHPRYLPGLAVGLLKGAGGG